MSWIKIDFEQTLSTNAILQKAQLELNEAVTQLSILQRAVPVQVQDRYEIAERLASVARRLQDMQIQVEHMKSFASYGVHQYQLVEAILSESVPDM